MQRAVKYLLWTVSLGLILAHVGFAQTPDQKVEDFADDLVKTHSPQQRTALLAARKELLTTELRKELIRRGNVLLLAGKYSDAFDVYSFAENVAKQIGDKEGIASASLDIGTVYFFQGSYAPALEQYQKARELFLAVGNKTDAAKALSGLALIYEEQHQIPEALKNFEQALKEFEVLKNKEEMGNTLSSIGAIYYATADYAAASKAFLRSTELNDNSENVIRIADAFYMQGDYKQAANYYQQSLKDFEGESAAGLVAALGGAANSNYYLGNYDAALDYYRRNMTVQGKLGDESGVAISLQGMGNAYRARGDFGSALASYLKSLAAAEHSRVKVSLASTLGSIGLIRALQGDNIQAQEYYGKSLALFEASGDKVGMARLQAQLGNVYYAEGNYDTALESYRKSLTLRQTMDDKSGAANLHAGIGTVYVAQKSYALALESYQIALATYESLADQEAIAETLTKLANVDLLQGDYTQTLSLSARAASLAKQTESFDTLWYARTLAGKVERALNQPALASQSFTEAMTILESLRSRPSTEAGGGRGSLLPYLAQMELLIAQDKASEALEVAERAKVQALSDLLRRSNARITNGMSAAEQAEERKLTSDLVSLELQLDRDMQLRSFDQARRVTLTGNLREARLALESFRKTLFAKHPQLKVNRGEPLPLKPEEAATLIADKQTAVLEYVVAEDNVFLFVLTPDQPARSAARPGKARTKPEAAAFSLKVYPLNLNSKELTERVWRFYQLLASRDEGVHQPARELYDLLVKPAEAQLANKTKLTIIPDGILWRLPFEALQPAADRYLIDQMSASYAPSLSALREMRKQSPLAKPTSAATLSAFGNPLLTRELLQRVAVTYKGEALAPSPEQDSEEESELAKLKTVYGDAQSRVFVGAAATEDRVRTEATRSGVLHFAAHAILDDASPMYSFIALSPATPPPGSGQQDDGLLLSGEIMNLHSRATLVVMSGASMERERLGSGQAAIALLWSWFVAGTPVAVISRWEVESPGVAQMMAEFHTRLRSRAGLKRSDGKAEALRQSALALRRSPDYQHPYYWSGFAMLGDGK